MKPVLAILLLILSCETKAQEDPAALAQQLTSIKTNEYEKVRAIFTWITDNISYKTRASSNKAVIGSASLRNYYEEEEEGPMRPVNERVSIQVLKRREAVCDGFARLFTTLCEYAGIKSEVIAGYARGVGGRQRFTVNHTWNSVMIDGKWYLLDVTWASGYLTMAGNEFVRQYDPRYFLTAPEIFFRDHYPDDARWTLLGEDKVPDEYKRSPFRQKSFTKYQISSFYPSTGIINAQAGETVELRLETSLKERDMNVCPDLLADSAIYTHSPSWVFLRPEQGDHSNEFRYRFNVTSGIEWLYLLYNDDLVLRYKVNVKGALR